MDRDLETARLAWYGVNTELPTQLSSHPALSEVISSSKAFLPSVDAGKTTAGSEG